VHYYGIGGGGDSIGFLGGELINLEMTSSLLWIDCFHVSFGLGRKEGRGLRALFLY